MRGSLIACFLACFWLAADRAAADRADDYIKSEMLQRRIPGLALTVLRNGKEIKNAAYGLGNLEHNVPVKSNTVFEIGSITKQFTAAGILLLAQEGKLFIDDKLSKHVKETPDAWSKITLHHLLTHTSGIKSYTGLDGFELTKHLTQQEFIKTIAAYPLEFAPGESWKYCNTGFNLLGFVIENLSGKTYWEFLHERIFAPLGMTSTTNRLPGILIANRASGYEQTNHLLINRDYDLTDVFSAGAIVSTVGDLTRWNSALDCENILNSTSKAEMWTPSKLNSGKPTKYGFGWFIDSVDGHKNIGHGGSTSGFSASFQRFPDDKLAIIILSNTDEQIASTLAKRIAGFYFQKQAPEQ